MAFFPFSGWKESFFGDLHGQSNHAVEFYTQTKVVIERWHDEWTRKLIYLIPDDMIKIANAPCSWGVLEFELEGKAAGFEQVLDEIRETGYQGTELGDWGFMPVNPAELRKELDKRSLSMVGAFVPVFLKDRSKHAAGAEAAVRTAKLMADAGFPDAFIVLADENGSVKERTLNAGRVKPSMGLTEDEWKVFAEGADLVAGEVKARDRSADCISSSLRRICRNTG